MRVSLVLTHQCNLGCPYCYAGRKFERSMSDEVAWKALKLAFSGPQDEPVEVSFFGGEPMLRFREMVRHTRTAAALARRRGRDVRFQVTTNGTVLDDHHLRFLARYGFHVAVSVDGVGEAHDRQRPFRSGRPSSPLVWRNLARAARALPSLQVLVVVTPANVRDLPETVEKLREVGVARISLLPEVEGDWTAPDREALSSVYHRLARVALAGVGSLSLEPFTRRFSPGWAAKPCKFGEGEVSVSPAGNLYPCARLVGTDSRPELRLGTVHEGPQVERAQALRTESQQRMAACGTGGPCACVAFMPGEVAPQIERYRFFQQCADDAARAARAVAVALEVI